MIKNIISFFFLVSSLFGQLIWHEGNLKQVNEVSLDIIVNGDEEPTWEQKLTQISLLFLEGYKLKINPETFSPSMVIQINLIKPDNSFLTSYHIELSVFDLFLTKEKYLENISKRKILKKFKKGIIYQQTLAGQSTNKKIILDIENSLLKILDMFINNWYQDNPMKQF
jgi:hypothetical protein|tara:strand:+ start:924 stop:1427 length:504 start_codon:yes stop_codon:yes gene_type:complete